MSKWKGLVSQCHISGPLRPATPHCRSPSASWLQTFQSCRRPLVSLCRHCTARHRAPAGVCHGFTIALCHCALCFQTLNFRTKHSTPVLITEHGTVQWHWIWNWRLNTGTEHQPITVQQHSSLYNKTEHWTDHWALCTPAYRGTNNSLISLNTEKLHWNYQLSSADRDTCSVTLWPWHYDRDTCSVTLWPWHYDRDTNDRDTMTSPLCGRAPTGDCGRERLPLVPARGHHPPYCTAVYCTTLHCTTLHYNALNCTTMHCTAPHCT